MFEQKQVVEKTMGGKTKEALKEQEAELKQAFEEELASMLARQKKELDAPAAEHESDVLTALRKEMLAEKNSALSSLQESLEQQSKEALEKALSSKATESDAAISSLKEEHANQLASLKEDHVEELSSLKEELTQAAADEKARVIELERSSAEAKLSEAKDEFQRMAAKEIRLLEEDLDRLGVRGPGRDPGDEEEVQVREPPDRAARGGDQHQG